MPTEAEKIIGPTPWLQSYRKIKPVSARTIYVLWTAVTVKETCHHLIPQMPCPDAATTPNACVVTNIQINPTTSPKLSLWTTN